MSLGEKPTLAVENVSKSFGSLSAVRDLSFQVRPGEIFGFLGPNGAGKTTTLRMLMGITAPDAGTVRYEGRDRIDRRRVGYLPEDRGLFEDAPVLETLAYLGSLRGLGLGKARSAAMSYLQRLDLASRAADRVNTLSRGNQQKVQFIAALLHRPALVALDEPFSGLDPVNQDIFLRLLRELRDEGTAILLSSHQLDLVERLADRFLLLSRGREVLSGTLDEIRVKTTGGRDSVLAIDVAPAGGERIDPDALRAALEARAPAARVELHPATDGGLRIDVLVPGDFDYGPILRLLSTRARIIGIDTHSLPLHEIYLMAVRGAGDV